MNQIPWKDGETYPRVDTARARGGRARPEFIVIARKFPTFRLLIIGNIPNDDSPTYVPIDFSSPQMGSELSACAHWTAYVSAMLGNASVCISGRF
jgi:hypothetical protein